MGSGRRAGVQYAIAQLVLLLPDRGLVGERWTTSVCLGEVGDRPLLMAEFSSVSPHPLLSQWVGCIGSVLDIRIFYGCDAVKYRSSFFSDVKGIEFV